MSTNQQEISDWFDEGVRRKATHMIVVCDTFDYEDFPVYVMPGTDVRDEFQKHQNAEMQRVMEVYSMRLPKVAQLAERRAFHFE